MLITMNAKHRLTVPAAVEGFKPGDTFEVRFDLEEGEIVFRKINTRENWVDVMLACPYPMDDLPANEVLGSAVYL
jgi:hypothetical protein